MKFSIAFLCVSLGFLAMTIAFNLGAPIAQGQIGQRATGFAGPAGGFRVLDDSGNLYLVDLTNASGGPSPCLGIRGVSLLGNMFGGMSPTSVVSMLNLNGSYFVLLENGDIYYLCTFTGESVYAGNVFGSIPVNLEKTTWGRIKAERR